MTGDFDFTFPAAVPNPQFAFVKSLCSEDDYIAPLSLGGKLVILPKDGQDLRCEGEWWIQEVNESGKIAFVTRAQRPMLSSFHIP